MIRSLLVTVHSRTGVQYMVKNLHSWNVTAQERDVLIANHHRPDDGVDPVGVMLELFRVTEYMEIPKILLNDGFNDVPDRYFYTRRF